MADARNEMTPQGYPSPQVEVNTARDIGPPAAPQPAAAAPEKNAGAIDADFIELGEKPVGIPISWVKAGVDALKAIGREAIMPALEKLIPMGAQEIANGLFTGNPYGAYGATSEPVPMADGHGIHGPATEAKEEAIEPKGVQIPGEEPAAAANDNAKILDMQPQIADSYDPTEFMSSAPQIEQQRSSGRSR